MHVRYPWTLYMEKVFPYVRSIYNSIKIFGSHIYFVSHHNQESKVIFYGFSIKKTTKLYYSDK